MARRRPLKKLRSHRWCNDYRQIQRKINRAWDAEDWSLHGVYVGVLQRHTKECEVCKRHFDEESRLLYSSRVIEDFKDADRALRESQQFVHM
jgi:hypothetical protein